MFTTRDVGYTLLTESGKWKYFDCNIKNIKTFGELRQKLKDCHPDINDPIIWVERPNHLNEQWFKENGQPHELFPKRETIICNYKNSLEIHRLDEYRIMYGDFEMFKELYNNDYCVEMILSSHNK